MAPKRKADSRMQGIVDARHAAMCKMYIERKWGEEIKSNYALVSAVFEELAMVAKNSGIDEMYTHEANRILEEGWIRTNPQGRFMRNKVENMHQDEQELQRPNAYSTENSIHGTREVTPEDKAIYAEFFAMQAKEMRDIEKERARIQATRVDRTTYFNESGIELVEQNPVMRLTDAQKQERREYKEQMDEVMGRLRKAYGKKHDAIEEERQELLRVGYEKGYIRRDV